MPKVHMQSANVVAFHCPGCECGHAVPVNGEKTENGGGWNWNGDMVAPTLNPSILVNRDDAKARCHSFVRDGQIMFLADCFHGLAGRTVPLPEWE